MSDQELAVEIVRRWVEAGEGASLTVLARMAISVVRQFDGLAADGTMEP